MTDGLLRVTGLSRSFVSGSRRIDVLRDLELQVDAGESVAIVGDSGVGKSTLLHLLGGLDRPDAGRVVYRGRDVPWGDPRAMGRYRNQEIGFVFQFHHLLPEFTALENVEMPFRIAGRRAAARATALGLLERLGLSERVTHTPGRMSGGEQQRVAIARAVAFSPALVLADEPTGNLDPATGARVWETLSELQRELGFALLLATHNERLAAGCDRVLRLVDGRLEELAADAAAAYFRHPDARSDSQEAPPSGR
jgi:lipoprotein-releasing system ATP-binding protein